MSYFAILDADGVVQMGFRQEVPEVGPPGPFPAPFDGCVYTEIDAPFIRDHPSASAQPKVQGRKVIWIETAALADLAEAAIARTYLDVDRVHVDAVGSRTTEYQEAETAARAYVATGNHGVADSDVHSFALHNPTGQVQTDQWAAEQIIARADAFRGAQKAMRNQRFQRQAEMRAAATAEELQAVEALWSQFITNLRAQLGLPSTTS